MHHRLFFTWLALTVLWSAFPATAVSADPVVLPNSAEFFPDRPDNQWHYRGQAITTPLQKVAVTRFQNVSTVAGTNAINGVEVKVFHDTNPGNHGPTDSYYRRDVVGIVYYGSKPGTTLEEQVTPYQVVTFPLTYPSTFEQFNRKDLDFGADLDKDGVNERCDLAATVSVIGVESVSVPAGTYPEALRMEARMTIRIHLSQSNRTVAGRDVMTAWFARGVGLVKYIEQQELPGVRGSRDQVTEITEELEQVELKPD